MPVFRTSTPVALVAVLVAAATLAGGCGGGGGGKTTTAVRPVGDWAESLCSDALTWKSSVTTALDSVKGSPSKDAITTAAGDVEAATSTFVDDIKALGLPDTQTAPLAKDELDNVADQLGSGVDSIKQQVDDISSGSGVVAGLASIVATARTMTGQVKAVVSDIQGLDDTGQLQRAFQSASSCRKLK